MDMYIYIYADTIDYCYLFCWMNIQDIQIGANVDYDLRYCDGSHAKYNKEKQPGAQRIKQW